MSLSPARTASYGEGVHGGFVDDETTARRDARTGVDRFGELLVAGLRRLEHLDARRRLAIVWCATAAAIGVNWLAGVDTSVMLEYVVVATLAAWLLPGWRAAPVVVASAAASGVVGYLDDGPDASIRLVVLNSVLRAATLCLIVVMVAGLRRHVAHAERAVQVDSLTGCESRRAILDRLESEVRQSHRHGTPLCVLYLDLDAFKSVNDRLGHAAGDDVLCRFVALVGAHVRERDVLGRVGGDEFLLVCPNTPLADARQLAQRLTRVPDIPAVTIGTAMLPPREPWFDADAAAEAAASELLAAADAAMYEAKPR